MKKKTVIQLASRDACTGCAACASVCPTNSITMREDKEGFLQPHIDADTCINCHKCEKTCPIVSPLIIPTNFDTQAYAAINKDEAVRMRSSSGGMFHALAKWTIEQGGVVFGARFNEQWEVVHDYTETLEGIEPFMRSKYVQSRIGDTFKQAKQFLEQGRWVLYSGTPCQIGGLKSYLHKDYDKLLTVDIVCHGVPSPKVWRMYLKHIAADRIVEVNMRDKVKGWLDYQQYLRTTSIELRETNSENVFMNGFLQNIYLRRSCYACDFKTIHRVSDISIADFWGVEDKMPEMFDNKGTSLIFLHTQKGRNVFETITKGIITKLQKIEICIERNPMMISCPSISTRRRYFFVVFNALGLSITNKLLIDTNAFFYMKKIVRRLRKLFRL